MCSLDFRSIFGDSLDPDPRAKMWLVGIVAFAIAARCSAHSTPKWIGQPAGALYAVAVGFPDIAHLLWLRGGRGRTCISNNPIATALTRNPSLGAAPTGVDHVHFNVDNEAGIDVLVTYTTPWQERPVCAFGRNATHLAQRSEPAEARGVQWLAAYTDFVHSARLRHLRPDTQYYFRCSNDTRVRSFRTQAPAAAAAFLVLADMGIDNSDDTLARITARTARGEFDAVLHIGDLAYADDHVFSFVPTWRAFLRRMAPVMDRLPYHTCPGNHEYRSLDPLIYYDVVNFQAYNKLFRMPAPKIERANASMFYSFNWGKAHIVMFDTETSYPNAPWDIKLFGDQMAWLRADLAAANAPAARAERPWIVALGHRPIYSSGVGYSENGEPRDSWIPEVPINSRTLQKTFENLFIENKVDLVISGHVHSYERLYPTKHDQPTQKHYEKPDAPTYVVVGNAGNIEAITPFQDFQPDWSAYRYSSYGYGQMQVEEKQLTWKFHAASTDKVLDQFVISK